MAAMPANDVILNEKLRLFYENHSLHYLKYIFIIVFIRFVCVVRRMAIHVSLNQCLSFIWTWSHQDQITSPCTSQAFDVPKLLFVGSWKEIKKNIYIVEIWKTRNRIHNGPETVEQEEWQTERGKRRRKREIIIDRSMCHWNNRTPHVPAIVC